MEAPQELSIVEIRKYMLENGCRVTNHALVKHFKRFLTDPSTQNEARKQFKTYVNVLATIKNENNQKFLILRKKYINECPSDEVAERAIAVGDAVPGSPGGASLLSEGGQASPFRQPPPYKPPPEVSASKVIPAPPPMQPTTGTVVQKENVENYRDCVKEFAAAVQKIDPSRLVKQSSEDAAGLGKQTSEIKETNKSQKNPKSISRENSTGTSENKENIPRFSFSSGTSGGSAESSCADKVSSSDGDVADNPISVKEATRKFNRMASEEESKIISPPAKKKAEQQLIEEKVSPEVLLAHPKSKEWIVSMAKASYQELAKLANEFPELVKLQTALHWAAKHGNEDVVKLIAGTYKADVNARTNGGYTPLHLAMQFGRENIFELLCNVYKANRDLMDWSGNKPLDYLKQRTSVSLTTYSSEYYDLFGTPFYPELNSNNSNIFDINNIRLLPGGGTISGPLTRTKKRSHLRYATISAAAGGSPLTRTQSMMTTGKSLRNNAKLPSKSMIFTEDGLVPCDLLPCPINQTSDCDRAAYHNAEDNVSIYRGNVSKDRFGTLSIARRKESFLRKTLRAAAATNKHNHNVVTNNMPTE